MDDLEGRHWFVQRRDRHPAPHLTGRIPIVNSALRKAVSGREAHLLFLSIRMQTVDAQLTFFPACGQLVVRPGAKISASVYP
jgi:hypothetical protein